MSTFLIRSSTYQSSSYPIVLTRLSRPRSRPNPHLKFIEIKGYGCDHKFCNICGCCHLLLWIYTKCHKLRSTKLTWSNFIIWISVRFVHSETSNPWKIWATQYPELLIIIIVEFFCKIQLRVWVFKSTLLNIMFHALMRRFQLQLF